MHKKCITNYIFFIYIYSWIAIVRHFTVQHSLGSLTPRRMSHRSSLLNMILRLIVFYEEHELDMNNVLILKDIQEKAMTECMPKKKQKTITDFFTDK